MCTVTIIPKGKNDFILTSNRDVAPNRVSMEPAFYDIDGTKLLYPKDILSGGTWIGLSEKNRLVCVLNGGFIYHKSKPKYRLSRGVVAKDFMISNVVETAINSYNFEGVEPFTMVIVDWNTVLKFYELVWDGVDKHFKELPLESRIWSSATLYTKEMKKERSWWFEDFKGKTELNASSILQFHKTAGKNNLNYGVIMDRGSVKTTSITQVEKVDEVVEMHYENLQNISNSITKFNFPQIVNE